MRSASEVADVFRRHGAAYRQARAGHLGRVERRVMAAIEACAKEKQLGRDLCQFTTARCTWF
ncbi:hypothetical protein DPM35_27065 [Mesorhizobium atlanticum]|uniref:Uncharacterized protein n=1 Tax=Mesorhizobium atlanticum TaxID=2233532 RepID=A0A330GJR7_9HYPH|nr:hypothetical protein DPM35_27065 [Mesorhizobium atlanticum]